MTVPTQLTSLARRQMLFPDGLLLTPDRRWLVSWGAYGARIFEAEVEGTPRFEALCLVEAAAVAGPWIVLAVRGTAPHLLLVRTSDLSTISLPLPADPRALALAAQGDQIACATTDGQLHLIRIGAGGGEGTLVHLLGPAERVAMAFAADGASLAVAAYGGDAKTCPVQVFPTGTLAAPLTLKGARAAVYSLAFSPGGGVLVALTSAVALAWSLPKGKSRTLLRAKSYTQLVGFASEDCVILLDHDKAIVAVDPQTDREIWREPNFGPADLRGGVLVHSQFHVVLCRDALTGALRQQAEVNGFPRAIVIDEARQCAYLTSSAGLLVRRWPLASAALDPHPEGWGAKVTCAIFSADSAQLALGTAEPALALWSVSPPHADRHFLPPRVGLGSGGCHAVSLASGQLWSSMGKIVQRWDPASGQLLASSPVCKDEICALLALPDLNLVVACAKAGRRSYGELAILDATSLELLHSEQLSTTARSIDRIAQNRIRVHTENGWFEANPIAHITSAYNPPFPSAVRHPFFSADGRLAAAPIEKYDREARTSTWTFQVWSVDAAPAPLFDPIELPDFAGAWAFFADNEHLLSLHKDALRVWQARTGAPLFSIPVHTHEPRAVWISPDQRKAVIAGSDGSCDLYPLPAV